MAAMGLPRLGVFPAWWDSGCSVDMAIENKSKLHSTVEDDWLPHTLLCVGGHFYSPLSPLLVQPSLVVSCAENIKLG